MIKKPVGDIVFRDVCFSHTRNQPLFDGLSFTMPYKPRAGYRGCIFGLVGRSGSGKTTLINILTGHLTPSAGEIYVGGVNMLELDPIEFRRKFALVPQQLTFFKTRSVLENIIYNARDAQQEKVAEAIEYAKATEFINQLPNRENTLLGDEGLQLSGGQFQRIALANAILSITAGDAQILVIDEGTSALDSATEYAIRESIEKLAREYPIVVIIIAHQFSVLTNTDSIFVFDAGKIVCSGTHEALLSCCNLYRALWDASKI